MVSCYFLYMSVVKKKVMGFGTFDGLHPGHLDYFHQLRELGDEVVIVIAQDWNVERLKGRPAKLTMDERLKEVMENEFVDLAVLGNKTDFYQVIRDHKPDVIGLGYDQKANLAKLAEEFPDIEILRLEAFEPEKYKSSLSRKD